jgi:YHS domain-containing protein
MVMLISCQNKPGEDMNNVHRNNAKLVSKYRPDQVDNILDPSCMMPLTAGIEDTAHYKGFVLGFCSTDCKKDFFKDPDANLKLARLKKH